MRIVFMGTPEFAVATLDRIIQAGHEVVGVVTTPDKPAGRGQHLKISEVKNYALQHHLKIMQPEKMKDETFIAQLQTLQADVFVVVAFRMLPRSVYTIPAKGTFNVHASLLPQYRGAAPIQWAIINGETETGVTTFFLDEHTDTGQIIKQKMVEITRQDDAGQLHDKLMQAGAEIAVETLRDIEEGTVHPVPQQGDHALKSAPKIFKEDMLIDWNRNAEEIYNHIRGLAPYPTAYTRLIEIDKAGQETGKKVILKIYRCHISHKESVQKPGYFEIEGAKKLRISTKNKEITVESLQIEGKKRMETEKFLAGFRPENYTNQLS